MHCLWGLMYQLGYWDTLLLNETCGWFIKVFVFSRVKYFILSFTNIINKVAISTSTMMITNTWSGCSNSKNRLNANYIVQYNLCPIPLIHCKCVYLRVKTTDKMIEIDNTNTWTCLKFMLDIKIIIRKRKKYNFYGIMDCAWLIDHAIYSIKIDCIQIVEVNPELSLSYKTNLSVYPARNAFAICRTQKND